MNPNQVYAELPTSTSANPAGPVHPPSGYTYVRQAVCIIAVGGALSMPGTTSGASLDLWKNTHTSNHHTDYTHQNKKRIRGTQKSHESNQQALSELRRLSGLTWGQLAQLFDVSRRSVHFWASGEPLNVENEQKLHKILAAIRNVDRGSAKANREFLVQIQEGGKSLLEFLKQGKFERFQSIAGLEVQREPRKWTPLSAEVQAMRKPLKPDELVGAIQEPLPQKKKRVRRSKVARKAK